MPDEFDRASEDEQAFRSAAIAQQIASAKKRKPIGVCYSCREPLPAGSDLLFCDHGCCEDYDNLLSAQRRNGRR